MFLDDFENYNSHYEKEVKKISVRSSYPKIVKETFDLKLEKSHGNYDLFFNKKGLLLHSVHNETHKNFKIIYGYNRKGILISAMSLISESNILISLSEFEYDEKGRIKTETERSFYGTEWGLTTRYIHTYSAFAEELLITVDDEDEEDGTFYYTYDDKNRIIEEKAISSEDDLIDWNKYEYCQDGNLLKQISLDEYGQPDGVYEFLPLINGLSSGYIYKSNDRNYLREYSFTFNEKGHWINRVMMNDGEAEYYKDRTIEYY